MTGRTAWPVVLVAMPFADADRPSLQIGLLKPAAEAAGFPVRTLHANLDLAARLGADRYRALAAHRGRMIGDWLFSVAAFGPHAPDPDGRMLDEFAADLPDADLRKIRDVEIPAFLDDLAADPVWAGVRVAGFTSTFQQNTASFALARRLKLGNPGLVTMFGGANFDGSMGPEYVRAVDCIDYAVSGAGETAFPALLAALADGSDPALVPGVIHRSGGEVRATEPAPPTENLDRLPVPDYDEYFARRHAVGLPPPRQVWLPFESSRGCWWGAKHHCTFCGLNGTTMAYRAKSAGRVLDELASQARRYRTFRFEAVDNILDPRHLGTLMPALTNAGYDLFYEVKANLGRAQVRLLAQAGVRRLQPGVESLSSRVLRLMRKGVRAAQNVNLLRWSRYYGIDVAWNVLWGFPGEEAADYAAQASAVPHLVHLQPPGSAERIWLERFSPLFDTVARTPEASYRYVYPESVDLDRAAYFFDWLFPAGQEELPASAYADLRREVAHWQELWASGRRPSLTYRAAPGLLQIDDRRRHDHEGGYTFPDPVAAVYLACVDRPRTAPAVAAETALPPETVRRAFDEFAARGLMFLDEDLAVALALPDRPPA